MSKRILGSIFGDIGHTLRTVFISTVATALAVYCYNKFIKDPIVTFVDAGKVRVEQVQLQSNFDAYKAMNNERWIKRGAEVKELTDQLNAAKIDIAYLKGRVR